MLWENFIDKVENSACIDQTECHQGSFARFIQNEAEIVDQVKYRWGSCFTSLGADITFTTLVVIIVVSSIPFNSSPSFFCTIFIFIFWCRIFVEVRGDEGNKLLVILLNAFKKAVEDEGFLEY